ncbi:MAG: hypothetical protein AAB276_09065, partial [Pseudomonadota bacterium]
MMETLLSSSVSAMIYLPTPEKAAWEVNKHTAIRGAMPPYIAVGQSGRLKKRGDWSLNSAFDYLNYPLLMRPVENKDAALQKLSRLGKRGNWKISFVADASYRALESLLVDRGAIKTR